MQLCNCNNNNDNKIYNDFENILYDNGFIEKFQYFDLPFLNNISVGILIIP